MKNAVAAVVAISIIGMGLTGCSMLPSDGVRHLFVYSSALHQDMKVDVYLPPGYNRTVRYPVLYLLHGKDANQDSWMSTLWWFDSIHINTVATRLIQEGRIRPLVIVSPEIDNSYGMNTAAKTARIGEFNRGQYETFIRRDLVRYIDSHYSVLTTGAGRFIGGFSMGGFAALSIAFRHPQEYAKVAVFSAALWNGPLPQSLAWVYPTATLQRQRDPFVLAAHRPIRMPVLMIEGTRDPFRHADAALAHRLSQSGAPITWHLAPGGHTFRFWRAHAAELLEFVAAPTGV